MRTRRWAIQLALPASLATIAVLGSGCVSSEKVRYAQHLSRVVTQDASTPPELAMRFGLDEYRAPLLAQSPDTLPSP